MKPRKKDKKWTLIIIADAGPLASFQIKRSVLRIAAIILAGIVSIAALYLYCLNVEHGMVRKDLEHRLVLAEKSYYASAGLQKKLAQQVVELEGALVTALDESDSGKDYHFTAESGIGMSDLVIDNFEVIGDSLDGTIRFKFLLMNRSSSGSYVSGYVFVLYRPDYLNWETWSIFPMVTLKAGMPEDPTMGDP
ncbi:MAG: hypothetical protein PHU03_01830, partial [Syntrophales bacterium]|nr:hypothetical protein [Syntrophales bacterium]